MGGTAQWDDPEKVRARFVRFGVENIVSHYRLTSEAFFQNYPSTGLGDIDLAFIDGNHAFSAVRHDFLAVLNHSHKNSYLLMHDTHLQIRELLRHAGVKRLTRRLLKNPEDFEVIDFPFSSGLAMIRVLNNGPWESLSL